MTATAKATAIVEQLLGDAGEVIAEALSKDQVVAVLNADGSVKTDSDGNIVTQSIGGDPKVAMWVIDRVWPKKGAVLPRQIGVDITTIQGVIECATVATNMVLKQEMSVQDAQELMNYLLQYCQLRAFDHIDELRQLIQKFEQQSAGAITKMDPALVPQWGRLSEDTKTANDTPAE